MKADSLCHITHRDRGRGQKPGSGFQAPMNEVVVEGGVAELRVDAL
ncbi:MAG TPA: hypothetical protein VG147_04215 [Solirubrobacteraceae bacterium]|nr:hypothetical protein [Solirubrobacteraceae bacterium]